MSLHTAVMAGVFLNQVKQAPIVMQVAQAAPESWIKWLMPTVIQTVVSLASISAGVAIAVCSFRANRSSEHERWVRNQRTAHEQWIRDQSKAEWKEMLLKIAEIEHELPVIVTSQAGYEDLRGVVLRVLPLLRGTVFVYPLLDSSGFIGRWESFAGYISGTFERVMHMIRAMRTGEAGFVAPEQQAAWMDLRDKEEVEVRTRLHSFLRELRNLAHVDLGLKGIGHDAQSGADSE